MSRGFIVRKAAGQIVPEDYLKRVLQQEPSFMAVAGVLPGDNPTVTVSRYPEMPDIADIAALQTDMKDQELFFYFAELPPGPDEDDRQPHVLAFDEGENPMLVAFLEGDFGGFGKPGTSYTDEYYVIAELIGEMVSELIGAEGINGDIPKMLETIETSKITANSLKSAILGHGTILFVPAEGKPLVFSKGDEAKEFPWGWVSDHLSFGEEKAPVSEPVKTETPAVKVSPFDRLKGNKTTTTAPPTATKPVASTEPIVQGRTENATIPLKLVLSPPSDIKDKNKRKQWYRDRGHANPDRIIAADGTIMSWNKNPSIVPTKGPEFDAWEKSKTKAVNLGDIQPQKDTASHHIPPTQTTPSLREKLGGLLKGKWAEYESGGMTLHAVDAGGRRIVDPRILKELDTKLPDWTQLTGIKLEETFNWPRQMWLDLNSEFPGAMITLALNYRSALVGMMIANSKAEAPVEPPKETKLPAAPTLPPKATPAPQPQPTATPAPEGKRKLVLPRLARPAAAA